MLSRFFNKGVLDFIAGCFPPKYELGKDCCVWSLNSKGLFSIKSAYFSILKVDVTAENNGWKVIWNSKLPPRIKQFLWLVRHQQILTNNELVRRKIADDASCSLSGLTQETVIHVLRDCKYSTASWLKLLSESCVHRFFELDIVERVDANLKGEFQLGDGCADAAVIFGVLCWILWKHGNEQVFCQKSRPVEESISAAVSFATTVCRAIRDIKNFGTIKIDKVRWKSPTPGWVKINFDGAACMDGGWSSVGGVLSDSRGNWIAGYQRCVLRGSALNAELWTILHGLEVAWRGEYRKAIVETDCLQGVELITDCSGNMASLTIVRRIQEVARLFYGVKFQFVHREDNKFTD